MGIVYIADADADVETPFGQMWQKKGSLSFLQPR